MMYTPSPPSKRPRPPSSAAHIRMRKTSLTAATSQPLGAMGLSSMPSDQTIVGHGEDGAGPSIRRISGEGDHEARPMDPVGRTTPSPQSEAAEVSFALDGLPRPASTRPFRPASLVLDNIARQEAIPPAQASPPPPYGQDLPSHSNIRRSANPDRSRDERGGTGTPPCQDSARTSNTPSLDRDPDEDHSEEALRLKRATEAAKAMGLDIDFGMSSNASASGDESDDLPGSEVKRKLRDVKHQLKQRDQGKLYP